MMKNMVASLFEHKEVRTTHAKAQEARRLAERLITFAKRGDLSARRQVLKFIPQKTIVKTLFEEIAPLYAERNGGYTRIIKMGFRAGDAAPVSILQLVDAEKVTKEKSKKD